MIDIGLLLTQLLVILAGARLVGRAVRLVGQPLVIGEMLAGLALGPSFFGLIAPRALAALFPPDKMVPLATLSQLGVILFMFVVGLRMDLAVMRGRLGSAVAISHASMVIPFVLGAGLGTWIYPELAGHGVARLPFVLFTAAAMSVTAFPVLARILAERRLVRTRLGSIAIACAAVDDVTAWCLLAAVVAVARASHAFGSFAMTLASAGLFTVLAVTVGRRALRAWLDRANRSGDGEITAEVVGFAALLALAFALVTEVLGVHPLFGAFLDSVVGTVLLPVFFVLTGLRTEVSLVSGADLWGVFSILLLVAVAGKLGGSAAAARVTGLAWPEAIAIGVLMNTRGLMELVILNVGLEIGVISPALFAMMVLMALVTTVATSPILSVVLRAQPQLAPEGQEVGVRR